MPKGCYPALGEQDSAGISGELSGGPEACGDRVDALQDVAEVLFGAGFSPASEKLDLLGVQEVEPLITSVQGFVESRASFL